jgi:hypothetical protein
MGAGMKPQILEKDFLLLMSLYFNVNSSHSKMGSYITFRTWNILYYQQIIVLLPSLIL